MDNSFRHAIHVKGEDIDELGHVNNVVYLRWVQEVASAHWNFAANEQLKGKYSWVVLRHEIDYRHPVFLSDKIVGDTWVGEHTGARFERFVRLCLADSEKIVAEAKTVWCLLDAVTLRPKRIEKEILDILQKQN